MIKNEYGRSQARHHKLSNKYLKPKCRNVFLVYRHGRNKLSKACESRWFCEISFFVFNGTFMRITIIQSFHNNRKLFNTKSRGYQRLESIEKSIGQRIHLCDIYCQTFPILFYFISCIDYFHSKWFPLHRFRTEVVILAQVIQIQFAMAEVGKKRKWKNISLCNNLSISPDINLSAILVSEWVSLWSIVWKMQYWWYKKDT